MKSRDFRFRVVLYILILVLISGCTAGKKVYKPVEIPKGNLELAGEELDKYIKSRMKADGVIGFSIAVVDKDKVLFKKGYGYADKEKKIPVTTETIFRLGSISKVFTGTAVMQLQEQGKIDIDKPLNTYIPEFSIKSRYSNSDPITPRNIMTHHSGLPSDRLKDMKAMNPISLEQLVLELQDEYTAFPPNKIFSYSNLAISLLGRLVEVQSGEDFVSYTDKNLFKAMDMSYSTFELKPGMEKLFATGYIKDKPQEAYKTYATPAGMFHSNADDMTNFMMTILNNGNFQGTSIIKPETLEEMWRKQNEGIELDYGYDLGLIWVQDHGLDYAGTIYMHDGAWDDFCADMEFLPSHNLAVVTMSNSHAGMRLNYSAAKKAFDLYLQAIYGLKKPDKPKEMEYVKTKIYAKEELKTLAGYYGIHPSYGALKITEKNGKLFLVFDKIKIEMKQQDNGYFSGSLVILKFFKKKIKSLSGFRFTEMGGHRVITQKTGRTEVILAIKIPDPEPIPEAWKKRVGHYEVINLAEDEVLMEDIKQILFFTEKDGYFMFADGQPITILGDNEAVIAGLGRNKGDTILVVERDGEEVLKFAGLELKKKKDK